MKRQRGRTKIKLGKRKKAEPFTLPKRPGTLAGFYFSCGPVAAFGFFLGNLEGFMFAIVGDVMFWVLITLLKDIEEYQDVTQRCSRRGKEVHHDRPG